MSYVAADLIEEGDVVFIDSGTTANILAKVLKEKFTRLVLFTYSLDVFNILCYHKDFEVFLVSGCFDKKKNVFYGSMTLETLSKIRVKKAFMCPSAISIKYGICDYLDEINSFQKYLVENSDSVYILADSTKLEKKALFKFADMSTNYFYVTDSNISHELEKFYREKGYNVIIGK